MRPAASASGPLLSKEELRTVPGWRRAFSRFSNYCGRLIRHSWAWQLLAAVISIAAATSLLVLLVAADGQPQRPLQIGAYQLSLNTMVAAIVTILRTSLLVTVAGALNQCTWNWFASPRHSTKLGRGRPLTDLDIFGDAATDSWSSIKLLFRTQCRTLASLGALVTILSLAFDTFAQSVLSLDIQPTEISNDGSVAPLPRASSFINPAYDLNAGNGDLGGFQQAPIDITNALFGGVFTTSPPLVITCPVDYCSWPLTPSLGVCSTCTDATSSITKTSNDNSTVYSLLPDNATLADPDVPLNPSIPAAVASMTIASAGIDFNISVLQWSNEDSFLNLNPSNQLAVAQFYYLGIPINLANDFIRAIQVDSLATDHNLSQIESLIVAYQCTFTFCLQLYQANTSQHVANESVVSSWDQMKVSEPDGSWGFADIPSSMNVDNASAYLVDRASGGSLATSFAQSLGGSATYDSIDGNALFANIDGNEGGYTMPVFLNASSSLASMSALCKNIADSLTTHLRTSFRAAVPDARYAPTLHINQTIIAVRWWWLTFPLGLLVFGHIFLLGTIRQTRRLRVKPWKGHRIPLLLSRLDDSMAEIAAKALDSGGNDELEDQIGHIKVRLDYDENSHGIAFERVND